MVARPLATAAHAALKKVPRPHQIAAIGRNYLSHIKELNNARPAEPFFFLKAPSTVLSPGEGPVLIPKGSNVHYEVELGVIMGKDIDNIKIKNVEGDEKRFQAAGTDSKKDIVGGVIGGYFVGIDMTSRTYQDKAKKAGLPWTLSKNLKTFTPVSHIIPRSALPPFPWNTDKVRLHLSVNGEERQNDPIDLMLFKIPELVEHVSSVMPLFRNDFLLTGTPKGVGEVKGGDKMSAWLSVNGEVLEQSRIEVDCVWREDGYGAEKEKKKESGFGLVRVDGETNLVRVWKTMGVSKIWLTIPIARAEKPTRRIWDTVRVVRTKETRARRMMMREQEDGKIEVIEKKFQPKRTKGPKASKNSKKKNNHDDIKEKKFYQEVTMEEFTM